MLFLVQWTDFMTPAPANTGWGIPSHSTKLHCSYVFPTKLTQGRLDFGNASCRLYTSRWKFNSILKSNLNSLTKSNLDSSNLIWELPLWVAWPKDHVCMVTPLRLADILTAKPGTTAPASVGLDSVHLTTTHPGFLRSPQPDQSEGQAE